ncbi:bestrophin family protein [Sorangium sp. So ce426]|uniref:bestrophin family protein n=1 Tax=unclassified Sorangium TaxID=2621164 RepID=UPI003F5C14D2
MSARRVLPGSDFWHEAFALQGAVAARLLPRMLVFALAAVASVLVHQRAPSVALRPEPIEASTVVLGLLLVFRTNAGYARWWEARALWGSIVNQARNLTVSAFAYGPTDAAWRQAITRWVAVFAHVTRRSLRAERALPEVVMLVGAPDAAAVAGAEHMPSYASARLAVLLRDARDQHHMDPFAFLQLDRERVRLLEHAGGCERILATPIPSIYSFTTRSFIAVYLLALPLALVSSIGWFTPIAALFITYPILAVEQIGAELQIPFAITSLSHLPLDEICGTIERNVLAATVEVPLPPGSAPTRGQSDTPPHELVR